MTYKPKTYFHHADPYFVRQSPLEADSQRRLRWRGSHFRLPKASHVIQTNPEGDFKPAVALGHLTHQIDVGFESQGEYTLLYRTQRNLNAPGLDIEKVCLSVVSALVQAIGQTGDITTLIERNNRKSEHPWSQAIHGEYRRVLLKQLHEIEVSASSYMVLPTLFNNLYQST